MGFALNNKLAAVLLPTFTWLPVREGGGFVHDGFEPCAYFCQDLSQLTGWQESRQFSMERCGFQL